MGLRWIKIGVSIKYIPLYCNRAPPRGDDDFVVLHLGTVCSRKGQVFSATACAKLIQDRPAWRVVLGMR